MVMISVMIKVIVFVLCLGTGLAVLIYVPAMIYVIPYALWVGGQTVKGQHVDKKDEPFWRSVKNATRLYRAKLTGREPVF